jgi:exonuclease SbcD
MDRLRARFPHALLLGFAPAGGPTSTTPAARAAGRSDHDVALDFVAELRGAPATPAEATLLREAIDACCEDTDLDVLVGGA